MKKMMSLLLSGMMVLSLAACSGSETAKETTKEEPKTEAKETAAKESEAATTEAKKELVTLKIGCVAATEPCVQIMKEAMEGTGYEVEVVEWLTDSLVSERLSSVRKSPLGVQSYVSVCSCRCHIDDDGRIAFDLANVCGGYRVDHVSLASLQHSDTGCILRNDLEGQAVYGRAFLPVVLVAHHLGIAAVYSLGEDERACTSRVLCKIVAGVLHSHSLRRYDTELGDLVDECVVGFF